MKADIKQAETEIPVFHRQLDAGQFATIYSDASPELRRSTTQSDMTQFLSAVHRKLGNFVSGKTASWNDNFMTGGHLITDNYSAQYAKGAAVESFVYRIDGSKLSLVGYHVNSTALVLN